MALGENDTLRIDWVEDHLNFSVENEAEDGYSFVLLGILEVQEQKDGAFLITVKPSEDTTHYQFNNEKNPGKILPGFDR